MRLFPLLFLLLITTTVSSQTIEEYRTQADAKFEAGDYNDALFLVEKAIKLDSTDYSTRLLLSDILLALNEREEAKRQLIITTQLHPSKSNPYNRLGIFHLEINDLNKSVHYYSLAIEHAESDTLSFAYYINRATAKGVLRKFDESIRDFEKAYAFDNNDPAVLNNLATMYMDVGKIDKGIAMLKKLATIDPNDVGVYVNLGLIYSEIDSLKLSEFYFDKGLELYPEEPLLLNNKGFLHYKKKEYNTAIRCINASLKFYPANAYAYRNRALVHLALKKTEEACKDLSTAEYLDFKSRYGNEVQELLEQHCR